LHLETFDARLMITDIINTLRPAVEKNKNTLRVHLADDVDVMRADITKVRQILFNLLSNACKFTDQGSIALDVEQILENGEPWVRFTVADTGIGIDAKQKNNLFKEFAQADTSIARKYGGTGLGLAISYRFVQLMKGRIGVVSELGKGATFTVELPAQVKIEAAGTAPADTVANLTAPANTAGRETILVIDDDPAVRDLMSRSLSKLEFNVVAASNGDEGIRIARQVHPEIITLDVMMPERDGWSVLTQMKGDPELSKIPVIMVTIVDNEALGINLGASSYLVKPVDRERLAALIEEYRGRTSSEPRTIKVPVSLSSSRKHHEGAAEVARRR
jgi:CheY-like chemotaxis protein